jgi:hypothetical protein
VCKVVNAAKGHVQALEDRIEGRTQTYKTEYVHRVKREETIQ